MADNAEVLGVLNRFPNLGACKLAGHPNHGRCLRLAGLMDVNGRQVRIEVFRTSNPDRVKLEVVRFPGGMFVNRAAVEGLEQEYAKSPCLQSYFMALRCILASGLEKTSAGAFTATRVSEFLLRELCKSGWENVVALGADFHSYRFRFADSSGRRHHVGVVFPPDFPKSLPKLEVDLPEEIDLPFDDGDLFTLKELENVVVENVEKYVDFWSVMDEIDEKTWVIDPTKPRLCDTRRIIVLGPCVSLKIEVNPLDAFSKPTIDIMGPTQMAAPLKEAMEEEFWDEDCQSVVTNLANLLRVEFPAKGSVDDDDNQRDCVICMTFDLDGKVPEVVCDNCASAFHASCLMEWLISSDGSSRVMDQVSGRCVSCEKPIKCPRQT